MPRVSAAARGNLSVILSTLALLVALSGTAYAVGKGSIKAKHLAPNSVTTAKIKNGAVTGPKLRNKSVSGPTVLDGSLTGADVADGSVAGTDVTDDSLTLADLGGSTIEDGPQTTVLGSDVTISAGQCQSLSLRLYNPAPNGVLGSMVVGTVTTAAGNAVVSNSGSVLPTLVTETSQGGAIPKLVVCAGSSPQFVPSGSIVAWRLVAPAP